MSFVEGPGLNEQRKLWAEVDAVRQELLQIQTEMLTRSDYLRQGSASRINKYVRQTDRLLGRLERAQDGYDRVAATQLYFDGVKSTGITSFKIPTADLEAVTAMSATSRDSHHAQLATIRKEVRRFGRDIRSDKKGFINTFDKYNAAMRAAGKPEKQLRPQFREDVRSWALRHRVRGMRYVDGRRWDLDRHEAMAIRTMRSRAQNLGKIAGYEQMAAAGKSGKYLLVSDGPGCGWTDHHDPETANGKIVTFDEARAYPIAHPNCQRTFTVTDQKPKKKERGKTAKKVLVGAAAAVAAAEASNLAVQGIAALARSETLERMREELFIKAKENSDPRAFALERRIARFQNNWLPADVKHNETMVAHLYSRQKHTYVEQALFATGTEGAGAEAVGLGASLTFDNVTELPVISSSWLKQGLAKTENAVRAAALQTRKAYYTATGVAHDIQLLADAWVSGYVHYHEIPSKIRHLLYAVEGRMTERFSVAARVLRNEKFRRMSSIELRNAIQYEQRVKHLQQLELFEGTKAQSLLKFNWSRWGPRIRADVTDFFRFKTTKTPTGVIKSLTALPGRTLRSSIKMYQDGTIGGNLSLVPKGIFRAFVEIDDFGRVTGNVRLVPGGPIKLRLEFKTPRPHNWRQLGLIPGEDFVDWRAYQRLPKSRHFTEKLKDFTIHEAVKDLRQLELDRIVIDLRVLNTDVVELATNFRIPLREVKDAVRDGIQLGRLERAAGGRVSGLLTIPVREGAGALMSVLREDLKETVFADISFAKPIFRGEVRNRIHLTSGLLQDVVTNLRFRGYTIYDIGDLLNINVQTVKKMAKEGAARTRIFMHELGAPTLLDVEPQWQRRIAVLREAVPYRDAGMNRADLISRTLDGFTSDRLSPGHNFSIRVLAGIEPGDGEAVIELKLRSWIDFMRQSEIGSDEILSKLDDISGRQIRSIANKLVKQNAALARAELKNIGPSGGLSPELSSWLRANRPVFRARITDDLLPHFTDVTRTTDADEYAAITYTKYRPANHQFRHWETLLDDELQLDGTSRKTRLVIGDAARGVQGNGDDIIIRLDADELHLHGTQLSEFQSMVGLDGLTELPDELRHLDHKAIDAVLSQMDFLRQRFPMAPLPEVVFTVTADPRTRVPSMMWHYQRVIYINVGPIGSQIGSKGLAAGLNWDWYVHNYYTMLTDLTDQLVESTMPYSDSIIIHEFGHYLEQEMQRNPIGEQMLRLALREAGVDMSQAPVRVLSNGDLTYPFDPHLSLGTYMPRFTTNRIKQELGSYAASNYLELVAEGFRHWMIDDDPGEIATAIGRAMDEFFNWARDVRVVGRDVAE